ncbi:MAG: T9SS type A sorting domain-containing protein [Candidatus Cloacimonetes bacterium]|nr:T9SS type A sorting domain-containing protein [Candidatus Cloacimonadota bacterium]
MSSTSPCIDAGTPDTTGLHLPWLDVAGNPRVYGGRIDMGGLEWQGYSVDPDTNVVNNLYYFKNSPNPFKNETMISFTSLDYDRVRDYTLSIYNSRGQLVRRFHGPEEHFWAINEIVWNGKDMDGNDTAPGVYFYAIEYENTAVVRKMVKLR